MKIHNLLTLSVAASICGAPFSAVAQNKAAPEAKAEVKLDGSADAGTKLDPTGKLPTANKEEAVPVPTPVMERVNNVDNIPEALKKLPADKISKFEDLKAEATAYLRTVRLQEGLQKLMEAEEVVAQPVGDLENLRGAIYTKLKDYDHAREHFRKALTLDGEKFHPRFNLAELDFVEKKFDLAVPQFEGLIEENNKLKERALARTPVHAMRQQLDQEFTSTEKLMKYKLLISHLQLNQKDKADAILKGFSSFDDNCPAYYFSKACYEFVEMDKANRESPAGKRYLEKAQDWIMSAKNIYSLALADTYLDSIMEMGWNEL